MTATDAAAPATIEGTARRRMAWAAAVYPAAIVAASALLLLPVYLGAMPDTEDFASSVISTILQARALWDGTYPFWTSMFGLGIPHPFATTLIYHPLMPLFGVVSLRLLLPVFYQVHLLIGAFSLWVLCRDLRCSRPVALLCVLTYLLSAPTLYYTLRAFWINVLVDWTLAPLLLLALVRLLRAHDRPRLARYALLTGLTVGLMVANGARSPASSKCPRPGSGVHWRGWAPRRWVYAPSNRCRCFASCCRGLPGLARARWVLPVLDGWNGLARVLLPPARWGYILVRGTKR